jgi:TRAP-type C4-dicarboxylate transport system substrate-binding protein
MVLLVSVAPASGAPNVKYFTCDDVGNETHCLHQGIVRFAEEATNLTMGKIHFNLVPREAGCSEGDLIKQVQEGKLDGAIVRVEELAGVAPEFRMFTLPYLFADEEQAYRVLNGPTGADLLRSLKRKGIKGLAFVGMGWRQLVLREKRVETPADLTGLTIGLTTSQEGELVGILGAIPTQLTAAELAGAIDSEEVDGLSISLQTLYSEGFQRHGQYVALTGHTFVPGVIIMNPDKYGTLQQSEREGLMRAARRVQEYMRELGRLQAEEFEALLQKDGVQIYEVDQEAFAAAAAPLYEKWGEEFGKRTLEKIRNPE